jgi:hypothetical protein
MFNLNFLKKPAPDSQPNRCHFQHQNGRRCRLPVADATTPFCGTHRDMLSLARTKEEREAEIASITAEIYGPVKNLDSATAIHHVLSNLFRLTLQDRIPQRKAAQLTTQLRALLKSLEARRHEIATANLFPHNHRSVLDLLTLLNGENTQSQHSVVAAGLVYPEPSNSGRRDSPGSGQDAGYEEIPDFSDAADHVTVAPHSSLHRDRDRTCAAVFTEVNSTSNLKPEHIANLTLVTPPSETHFTTPNVSSQFPAPPTPGEASLAATNAGLDFTYESSTEVAAPTQPSPFLFDDHVLWIGPKPDQINWALLEESKKAYLRYLRQAYPPPMNGYPYIPPDKLPLWLRPNRRRK